MDIESAIEDPKNPVYPPFEKKARKPRTPRKDAAKKATKVKDRGVKIVDGKLRYDLAPQDALAEVVKVLTDGAVNYGDRNWEKGIPYSELIAAIERHKARFLFGEKIDPEHGTHHLAHLIVEGMMILAQDLRGKDKQFNDVAGIYGPMPAYLGGKVKKAPAKKRKPRAKKEKKAE